MKKILLTLLLISYHTDAQVGINTDNPDQSSFLDVNGDNKGVLLPRINLSANSISNPAYGLIVFDTNRNCIAQNISQDRSSPNWFCLSPNVGRFFYMPSIVFDTSVITPPGQLQSKNLYEEYKGQFSNPSHKNPDAPASIPYFTNSNELYYYVTAYDEDIIEIVNISNNGILTYRVVSNSTPSSLINIVFVVK